MSRSSVTAARSLLRAVGNCAHRRPASSQLIFALAIFCAATGARMALNTIAGPVMPFAIFIFATSFTAWVAGWVPAILVSVIGFAEAQWLLDQVDDNVVANFLVYQAVCGCLIFLTESLRVARARAMAEEEYWKRIINAIPQIIWTAAPNGTLRYLNEKWYEHTGMSKGGDLNVEAWSYVHPDDVERVRPIYDKAFRDETDYEVECRLRTLDGDYRWTLIRAKPHRDLLGRIEGWYGITIDIHDMKLAKEGLEAADRRKNEFLAMLSHELRNPLAPIQNAATILSRTDVDEEAIQWAAGTINRQVHHMVRMVNELLDVSRIMRGKVTLKCATVDLTEVLFRAVETSQAGINKEEHRFVLTLPQDHIFVYCDEVRLAQVVSNLLNNAAKYTPRGGRIDLWVERRCGVATIYVRDNGIGIEASILPHIWDSFVQSEQGLDRSQGGLGIGLAVVKGLVELHGGSVTVTSEEGIGSTFAVSLDTVDTDDCEEPPVMRPKLMPNGSRVLVVDDNADAAQSLATLLRMDGHAVKITYSGEAALELAVEFDPHVIFLDIGLPKLDGHEICRRLRAQPRFKNTCILALTGYGGEQERIKAESVGFTDHFVKPTDYEILKETLERHCKGIASSHKPDTIVDGI